MMARAAGPPPRRRARPKLTAHQKRPTARQGELMLEGRTLWELIEKRAEVTPDARMAVDESGREMTFGEYKDTSRARRGWAGRPRYRCGRRRHLAAAHLARVDGARRRDQPVGRYQNPILHIFREREVGFCVKESGAKLIVTPSTFASFDFEAMARGIASGLDDVRCARVRPVAARRRPGESARAADRRRRGALALLHLGHDRRPEGRVATPTSRSTPRRPAWCSASRSPMPIATRWPSRSRTSAASPGCIRA